MKLHKRLMASKATIEAARLRTERILSSIESAGFRWGNRLATETWHTDYWTAVSWRLRKFFYAYAGYRGPHAGVANGLNQCDPRLAIVAGLHPVEDGKISSWCSTGARGFNVANQKARAFDAGARAGFEVGIREQAKALAVSVGAYKILASLPHWHGLAKNLAVRIARSGQARFSAFQPLKTKFVDWNVGGTYRHKCLLKFDGPVSISEGNGGHHRPGAVGDLFGRGSSSKSGVTQVAPDTLEVFQDQ